MTRLLKLLLKLSRPFLVSFGFSLVALLALADYLTGYELSFSVFYLIPIVLVGWGVGRNTGILMSLTCAVVWYVADVEAGHLYSSPLIPYWNAATRLGFFLVVTHLIAGLRLAHDRESELARTDSLTGLGNSRSLGERATLEIHRAARSRRPLTLAYMDLDNFKAVNDRFGHSTGDALLQCVAQTLLRHTRRTDLVARLGGDEFALLLVETPVESVRTLLENLHARLLRAMEEKQWPVTFSSGAVSCVAPPESVDELIKRADNLMYTAKSAGKNRIVHETLAEEATAAAAPASLFPA